MNDILDKLRRQLKENADEAIRNKAQHFSKEKIEWYGVKTPIVDQLSKEYFKSIKSNPKKDIYDLCEELWRSGYLEESVVASRWSYALRKSYEPGDFVIFEKWVGTYVSNWASCDTFCNRTMGEFLQMYPQYLSELKKWTQSKNRWMRRAAAVSLVIPARRGKFLEDVLEIADFLLQDKDDLVQKSYGWMLKEASKPYRKEVFDFIMERRSAMPRTALRYAIEKMPPELKREAMHKVKKKRPA